MRRQSVGAVGVIVSAIALLMPLGVSGASLDPTNAPGPMMHTLEEIYQKVSWIGTDVVSVVVATNLHHTFDAGVPKTAQAASYAAGDDGDLEKGVVGPNPRFADNGDGTVTDRLTGLIWLENANAFGTRPWTDALADCNTLNTAEKGLSDGSFEGDWRLPNENELRSLVAWQYYHPAVPNTTGTAKWTEGNPFTGIRMDGAYWSSTTSEENPGMAWYVDMDRGDVNPSYKSNGLYVWPVRSAP